MKSFIWGYVATPPRQQKIDAMAFGHRDMGGVRPGFPGDQLCPHRQPMNH